MKSNYKKLGGYIRQVDERNKDGQCINLLGLSMTKEYRESTSNIVGTNLCSYKLMRQGRFACDFMSVIRVNKLPIVLHRISEPAIVSPAYCVFEVIDKTILMPEYLMLWCRREEFDRYAVFKCDSAIRGGFGWDELCNVELPIPSLQRQKEIVDAYETIESRIKLKRQINDNLEAQMSAIYREFVSIADESDVSIYNILSVTNGAAFSSEYFNSDGIGFPLIRIRDLKNSCPEVYTSEVLPNAVYINAGDIVIGMDGEFSPYIWIGETGLLNQRVCKVSPINANIHPFFLYATLKPILTEIERTQGGTTVIHLGKKDFDNMTCANLSDTKHIEYNNLVAPMYAELVANSRDTLSLVKLNQLLLSSLSR